MNKYFIKRATSKLKSTPELRWDDPARENSDILVIENFWDKEPASGFRPKVKFRMQWDSDYLNGIFLVKDKYVRALVTDPNGFVHKDSCVEFFVEPSGGSGYCNFEMNATGVLHLSHIEDPTYVHKPGQLFAKMRFWTLEDIAAVKRVASLKGPITEEMVGDCTYTVAFQIPLKILCAYTKAPLPEIGSVWRGNVFKCGDDLSHPHWGFWNPIGDILKFHTPNNFGELVFV